MNKPYELQNIWQEVRLIKLFDTSYNPNFMWRLAGNILRVEPDGDGIYMDDTDHVFPETLEHDLVLHHYLKMQDTGWLEFTPALYELARNIRQDIEDAWPQYAHD